MSLGTHMKTVKKVSHPPPDPRLLRLYKSPGLKSKFPVPNPILPPLPKFPQSKSSQSKSSRTTPMLTLIQRIKQLPPEIQLDILSKMNHDQLKHICKTETYFSDICKDESLWQKKVEMDYQNKFHWYGVWSDIYQDNSWRQFYIFLANGDVYQPTVSVSRFMYLVVKFSRISEDMYQDQLDELAENSYNNHEMLFCGIDMGNWRHVPRTGPQESVDNQMDLEKIQFTMELVSETPLNGFVFLANQELTVGYAFSLINHGFQHIYPEANSGDIVKIQFEPTLQMLYVEVDLFY